MDSKTTSINQQKIYRDIKKIAWLFIIVSTIIVLGNVIEIMGFKFIESGGLERLPIDINDNIKVEIQPKYLRIFNLFEGLIAFLVLYASIKMMQLEESGRKIFIIMGYAILLCQFIDPIISYYAMEDQFKDLIKAGMNPIKYIPLLFGFVWFATLAVIILLINRFLNKEETKLLFEKGID